MFICGGCLSRNVLLLVISIIKPLVRDVVLSLSSLLKAESEKIGDYEVIENLELSLRNLIVAKLLELTEKW